MLYNITSVCLISNLECDTGKKETTSSNCKLHSGSQALPYYEQTHLCIARFVSAIYQYAISLYCLIRYSIVLTFHTVLWSIGSVTVSNTVKRHSKTVSYTTIWDHLRVIKVRRYILKVRQISKYGGIILKYEESNPPYDIARLARAPSWLLAWVCNSFDQEASLGPHSLI